jgi:superfamily II DNA or RNA helicase
MTGSPTPNSPLDAWAQIRLLTPSNVTPYWKMFREQTMYQVTTFKWRAKRAAKDIVFTAMQPGVRFTLDQCADIPPTTYTDHDVTLSPQQEAAYAEMRRNMVTNFDPTVSITAVNAGVQVSKLLQICCGFAYDGNGIAHDLPMPERISVLKEIVESAAAKVIVFVPFKHAVRRVAEALRDEYSVEVMTGDTPKGERDRILTSFQHGLHPQVLVAHPKVTAHGHTLTAANVIVWFSPTTSAEVYEQANARIPRPGQKLHTHIVHLQSSKAEAKLYAALQGKLDLQAELLSLYKTLVNGDSNGKGKTR